MARFYINFRNANQLAKDDVGVDLPSLDEARKAALISAREIVADNIKGAATAPLEAVIITDEGGQELMTIPASEVLPEQWKH
jgi:DNA-binding transcriptional regulator LsrR (DeoR family)